MKSSKRSSTSRASQAASSLLASDEYCSSDSMELKGVDVPISFYPVPSTTDSNSCIYVLNPIQQGAASWNRVGRQVSLQSVRLQGELFATFAPLPPLGVVRAPLCRLTIVWDKQSNSTTVPPYSDIFGLTLADGSTSVMNIFCPIQYPQMARFQILFDRTIQFPDFSLSSIGTAPFTNIRVPFDAYVDLLGRVTTYGSNSVPITNPDIATGSLYLVARAVEDTDAARVGLNFSSRLRYYDH